MNVSIQSVLTLLVAMSLVMSTFVIHCLDDLFSPEAGHQQHTHSHSHEHATSGQDRSGHHHPDEASDSGSTGHMCHLSPSASTSLSGTSFSFCDESFQIANQLKPVMIDSQLVDVYRESSYQGPILAPPEAPPQFLS